MQNSVEVFKKIIIFVILAKMMSSHRASGFISNTSRPISCQGSAATIDFDFDLQGDSIASGSKVWYFSRILIGQDTGSGFTALGNYSGRLTNHLSHGLTLNNVTTADKGTYEYEIFLDTALAARTATASLTVYIGPLAPSASSGCLVYANQSGNTVTCNISGNCGTPPLNPFWVNFTTQSNQFECTVGGTYQCCATSSASASCYSGSSNDFCTLFNCTPVTTTTTTTTTAATTITMTTTTTSATNTETRTASTEKTTRTEKTTSTEKTTNTGMGTQSTIATSSCPLPVLVITGISVSGFLSILLIFIICCCCPCCCLYHCWKEKDKYKEDLVETNDNEDVNNHIKANAGTPNPAYVQTNAPNELGTYDKFKEVQLDDETLKALDQSNRLATNPTSTSNKEREDKPIPNKNEVIESEQL